MSDRELRATMAATILGGILAGPECSLCSQVRQAPDVGAAFARQVVDAILADTSPASQERDEDGLLERAIDRANFDAEDAVEHATATLLRIQRILEQPKGSIGKRKILRECRGAIVGLLARLRSGSEPGEPATGMCPRCDAMDCGCEWRLRYGKPPAARLSGESAKWGGPNPPHLIDDDPELNGEPHEPDCPQATPYEVGSGEPCECTCGGEGAPEPDDRAILRRLYGAAIGNAVYPSVDWTDCATKDYQHLCDRLLGTPGPDREAEIRADERRKVLEKIQEGLKVVNPTAGVSDAREREAVTRGLNAILTTLSPNRSDEP